MDVGLFLVAGVLLHGTGARAEQSVRTAFYLHVNVRNWNEAKLICEAETAELFRVTDEFTMEHLRFVDTMDGWNGMFSHLLDTNRMWLGLYESGNNTYLNHGCAAQEINNWAIAEPKASPGRRTCVSMDSTHTFITEYCNQSYYFMCQRPDGDCWFEPQENTRGLAETFSVDDVIVDSESDCATLCRNGWINNTECWAFSYRMSDRTCRLHYTDDSTAYTGDHDDNYETHSQWILYPKICFGGLLRNISVKYADDSAEPQVIDCTGLAVRTDDWDDGVCYCECLNAPPLWEPTISTLTLDQKIADIVAELTINSRNTSAAQRKLKSALDERPSAQNIGYMGIVFLSSVFGAVVILDLNLLFSQALMISKPWKYPHVFTKA